MPPQPNENTDAADDNENEYLIIKTSIGYRV